MSFKTALISGAALMAAGSFGAVLVSGSNAQSTAASTMSKDEIETLVRDYILDNPEIIVEALDLYELNRETEAMANALPALLNKENGYVAGATGSQAKIAVIEMFDYHCGYCKQATMFMNNLIETEKDIQVVFRELPILRDESKYAAEIALAAREQNKYSELHFAMMDAKGVLTADRIDKIARSAGVDVQALHSAHKNNSYDEALNETRKIAIDLGVSGTPTFIIATMDGSFAEVVPAWAPERVEEAILAARRAG